MTTQPIADLRLEAHRYSFHLGTEELIKRLPAPQSVQCAVTLFHVASYFALVKLNSRLQVR